MNIVKILRIHLSEVEIQIKHHYQSWTNKWECITLQLEWMPNRVISQERRKITPKVEKYFLPFGFFQLQLVLNIGVIITRSALSKLTKYWRLLIKKKTLLFFLTTSREKTIYWIILWENDHGSPLFNYRLLFLILLSIT